MPLTIIHEKKPKHTLAIAAGKGGVGKSTVTTLLARSLHSLGYKVGVLDADLYGPSITKMLPVDQEAAREGELFYPALSQGIKVLSLGHFASDALNVRGPIAISLIKQFLHNTKWGDLDYLLIDFPPGTGDIQLTLSQQANISGAIMVTTPQEVAVLDVKKAMHLFDLVKVPILGIIENMSYYLTDTGPLFLMGKEGGKRLAQQEFLPLIAEIPIDPDLSQSGDTGEPLQKYSFGPTVIDLLRHTKTPLTIKEIKPSSHTLQITWTDNTTRTFNIAALQKKCPCAECQEKPPLINDHVEIDKIFQVGRYGLRFEFSSGCKKGIYSLDLLKTF